MPYKTPEIRRKKALEYYYGNKEKVLKYQVEYKRLKYLNDEEYHKKDNVRKIATHRIKLEDKKCEKCGTINDLQRHHHDYSKPLDVNILCRRCHTKIDKKL